MFADRVAVLQGGSIVAEGSHDELSRSSVTYRELMGIHDAAA
jgi:ATP-binding cassette subfamily B protein